MAKTTNKKRGIFISFHENNAKSVTIAEELGKFFNEWQIECHIVKNKETLTSPDSTILSSIHNSDCFLQIFTDEKRSDWMNKEWAWAQAGQHENKSFQIVVLATSDSDTNIDISKELEILKKRYKVVTIDNEDNARNILSGILVRYRKLEDKHGQIEVPEFCKNQSQKEQIELGHVGEFIMNFIAAYKRGLKSVYPNREAILEPLSNRFKRLRKDKGTVRMLGFTQKRYVIPLTEEEKEKIRLEKKRAYDIGKFFEASIKAGANAELLLLDKGCRAATERMSIEDPGKPLENCILIRDSGRVSTYYLDYPNVEIRYYRTPYVGMVIFNDEAYVELYHLGKQIEDRTICGHVPIMLIKKNPDEGLYELFSSHFDNVWKQKNMYGSKPVEQ